MATLTDLSTVIKILNVKQLINCKRKQIYLCSDRKIKQHSLKFTRDLQ